MEAGMETLSPPLPILFLFAGAHVMPGACDIGFCRADARRQAALIDVGLDLVSRPLRRVARYPTPAEMQLRRPGRKVRPYSLKIE